MNKFVALPQRISQAIDAEVRGSAKDIDADDLLFGRLALLVSWDARASSPVRNAEIEVVNLLLPRYTLAEIVKQIGKISYGAAWARWRITEGTTPDSRREHARAYQKRVTPLGSPGMSVAEASSQLLDSDHPLHRSEIYKLMDQYPDADWFKRIPTQGKRGDTRRIVDLAKLKAVAAGGVAGVTVDTAARELGVDAAVIRDRIKRDPDAKWFVRGVPERAKSVVTRIVDLDGLRSVIANATRKG